MPQVIQQNFSLKNVKCQPFWNKWDVEILCTPLGTAVINLDSVILTSCNISDDAPITVYIMFTKFSTESTARGIITQHNHVKNLLTGFS
jgi:hypothetical protein